MLVQLPKERVTCANLIGGKWVEAKGIQHIDVHSPYTAEVIGKVPLSTAQVVAKTVEAAKLAQAGWGATPLKERTQRLFRFREVLQANLEEIGHTAAAESGKTYAEGRAGVLKGIEVIEYALSIQNLDIGGMMEVSRGVTCEYRREPLGVVAGITPFNFPAMVPLWMIPIAIALGNAYILKPSEKVPLSANLLGKYLLEAGVPEGVFSIVHGGRETATALVSHADVSAVGFVGSSAAAKGVYQLGTSLGKRVLALGGAKNHLIMVPDADPAVTCQSVVDSFTGCAGQRCMAASALVAVGECQHLIDEIVDRANAVELGPTMGAIIDSQALQRIRHAIDDAIENGATVLVDGRDATPLDSAHGTGYWVGPTVLDHVTPDMPIAQTEIFGPVLAILRASNLSEALHIQNRSRYGNACSVFTTNGAVAEQVVARAKAGMVGVNIGVPVPREPFSFGGIADSKFGHGDITGRSSLDLWTRVKKVTRKWSPQTDSNWMSLDTEPKRSHPLTTNR